MNYPSISEYAEAIMSAEENFSTQRNLRSVMTSDGRPFMCVGNASVVFKMRNIKTERLYAVKCFTKEMEQRERNYSLIISELFKVNSPYLIYLNYMKKELCVNTKNSKEKKFPILLMDWVEGQTMNTYIRENMNNKWVLERLCQNFCRMGAWLLRQTFAHGDLKPENIMVSADATPLLLDYDGMYVPAMKGEVARELGSPDYRHPLRTEKDFDEHIDDFPLASIALSLKGISLNPFLLTRYGTSDRLLFSADDYANLSQSKVLKELTSLHSNAELQKLASLFFLMISYKSAPSALSETLVPEEKSEVERTLSTEVTDEELSEAWEDKFNAFYSRDKKRLLKKSGWTRQYVVWEGTSVICDRAFASCINMSSIQAPNSLTLIGNGAFWTCFNLNSINLPDGLKSIGDSAFSNCRNLTSINLPVGLTSLGNYAFYECEKLTSISLPDGLTLIGKRTFYLCKGLTSVNLPKNLTAIGDYAFFGCRELTSINLPDNLISVGYGAFSCCVNLTSIKLPEKIMSIGREAFNGCNKLTSIRIDCGPDADLSVVKEKFKKLLPSNLYGKLVVSYRTEVTNTDLVEAFEDEYGVVYSKDGKRLLRCKKMGLKNYAVKEGTRVICDDAFKNCDLLSIRLPKSLASIGEWAFDGCEDLISINLPDDLTQIREWAFYNCHKLSSISLSNSLTAIGNNAFCQCYNLTSINLPAKLTLIEEGTFCGCKNLSIVNFPDSLISIGERAFFDCQNLTSINLPSSLISIGDRAFSQCYKLTSINLPNSLSSIGNCAFSCCVNLSSITLPKNLQEIKGNPFVCCNIKISSNSENFKVENDLLIQGKSVICVSSPSVEIIIPDYITHIGDGAFYRCTNSLRNSKWLSQLGIGSWRPNSIKFPEKLVSIGNRAFYGCRGLTSLTLPERLNSIGDYAFCMCKKLSSITLPDGVASFGKDVFKGCEKLKEIHISCNLASVEKRFRKLIALSPYGGVSIIASLE